MNLGAAFGLPAAGKAAGNLADALGRAVQQPAHGRALQVRELSFLLIGKTVDPLTGEPDLGDGPATSLAELQTAVDNWLAYYKLQKTLNAPPKEDQLIGEIRVHAIPQVVSTSTVAGPPEVATYTNQICYFAVIVFAV